MMPQQSTRHERGTPTQDSADDDRLFQRLLAECVSFNAPDPDSGSIQVPLYLVCEVFAAIKSGGVSHAVRVAKFGALMHLAASPQQGPQKTVRDTLARRQRREREGAFVETMVYRIDQEYSPWCKDTKELVACHCYLHLHKHELTWMKAAQLASDVLGKSFSPDAWRLYVRAWADHHGLPPIQLRQKPDKIELTDIDERAERK